MENILLINPNSPDPPPIYFGPPYGVALIAAVLEENSIKPICRDFERETYEEMICSVLDTIVKNKIKYVGISCQSSNRGYIYGLIGEIRKEYSDIVIILGGPFATQKYQLLLNNFYIDYIVLGDGEITFLELIKTLESNFDLIKVNGLAFIRNNKIITTNEREKVKNLDSLPFPAFHLFEVDKRLKENKDFLMSEVRRRKPDSIRGKRCVSIPNALMLLSSIGCIYGCSFCPMSGIKKMKYREHSPKYFVDMVEYFSKKYNQKHFVFGDNFFTRNIERVKEICEEIIRRRLNIVWICMTRADYLDLEILKKMKEAGCIEISLGIETCSLKVQKKIGKNLDPVKAGAAFKLCDQAGIRSVLMLMVGNEGETKYAIYETLSRIKYFEPDEILVKITKVYPGTKIHDIAEKKGIVTDKYYLSQESAPPAFTAEHSLTELRAYKDMIQLRDIRLEFQNICNNNCRYCGVLYKDGIKKIKTEEDLKDNILLLAKRVHSFTFCGKEPALRKDIFELVKYANQAGIPKIRIETNARYLSYQAVSDNFANLGLDKIIIPFFTGDKKIYDKITGVKGSFNQTAKGITNICSKCSDVVQINIVINKENYNSIAEDVDNLISIGVKFFQFEYDPQICKSVLDLKGIANNLKKVFSNLQASNKKFFVLGLPYCLLPDYENEIDEIHHPFDEIYTLDNRLVNIGENRRKRKKKTSECVNCRYDTICEGYWEKHTI